MKICTIILDYRNAKATEACLLSLVGQHVNCVLVVDNSADAQSSAQLASAIEKLIHIVAYDLKLLKPPTNLGFAGGVNFGLQTALLQSCDAILLLNNDATIALGAIAEMSGLLESGAADLVAPTVVDENNHVQPMMWYQRYLGLLTDKRIIGSYPYFSGCCLLLRKELIQDGKLFDESFFMYGEDTLLGWQLKRKGKIQRLAESAIVKHKGQDPLRPCSLFYEYQLARAHVLLACKTAYHPVEIPVLLATKSIGLVARGLLRSLRYRSGLPMLAVLLAWFPVNIRKA